MVVGLFKPVKKGKIIQSEKGLQIWCQGQCIKEGQVLFTLFLQQKLF